MFKFSGFEFTVLEQSLVIGLSLFVMLFLLTWRRLARLEARFVVSQVQLIRELKMVNQGSIGMGRRLAGIEKNIKKSSNVANFAEAKELKQSTENRYAQVQQALSTATQSEKPTVNDRTRGLTTRAEQALSLWINEHKTA